MVLRVLTQNYGNHPVPAIQNALRHAGLTLEEDLIEINEAFATQYLAGERTGINRE